MRVKILFFFPLFFLICLEAVDASGNPFSSLAKVGNSAPNSLSVEDLFKGQLVKKHVDGLFEVNYAHLKSQDELAEVEEKLEETQKILSYKKTFFEKEKKAGIESQKYITQLKTAYEKWEKLDQHLKDLTSIEATIPTERWLDIEDGPELLQKVQQLKSQVEYQMRELEAEHNVYASRKEQLEKGGQTLQQTQDNVKEETLSKLQSKVEDLKAKHVQLCDKVRTTAIFKERQVGFVVKSWIAEKIDVIEETKQFMDMVVEGAKNTLSPKDDVRKLLVGQIDPTKLKKDLINKFNQCIGDLITRYERAINGQMEEHDVDDNISNLRQELVRDRIQFKKQQNYLYDTQYTLLNTTLSANPLHKENAIIEIFKTILNHDDVTKRLAEKLLAKAKLLRSIIANSAPCKLPKSGNFVQGLTSAAHQFKREAIAVINQPVSTPLERELVSKEVKKLTGKQLKSFQRLMDYFSTLEQCAQAMHKIEVTITKVEELKMTL